ncbi:rRNA maturation RNase YbeY [Pedobacter sp. JCM 36344]|uniref:rRNA maturation RNase YbeY n=1 Tax=Pedobacter sp. JCM 36344 TaxID=3374280 RepID=UPI00397A5E40
MSSNSIHFFSEDAPYVVKQKKILRNWLLSVVENEHYALEELNFILCSDEYLLGLNQQYLDHDTYTDVITFDNSELTKTVAGDIFISIHRVKENAIIQKVKVTEELTRIMVHGTLHLLGYKDKTKADKLKMTFKEDDYLQHLRERLNAL